MKKNIFLFLVLAIPFFLASCTKEEDNLPAENGDFDTYEYPYEPPAILPEGYFEVRFATGGRGITKSAVNGLDGRVQHVRYVIYKSTGEYVKEKVVWLPSQGTANWPMPYIKDTLPNGKYKFVFLGNVEKTLFPYGSGNYADVLANYQTNYSDARITLPNAEFSNNSEYYWARDTFSNLSPTPTVLLQRIIGSANLHRNFVDARDALDTLVYNIATVKGYRNLIRNSVQTQLQNQLGSGLLGLTLSALLSGVNDGLNLLIGGLVEPVTDALYNILLQDLTNEVGRALTGNANQAGALAGLGALLNPWNDDDAASAIVTINNFPKSIDFDLSVREIYPNNTRFKYNFTSHNVYAEKDIPIKGFGSQWNIQKINVIRPGLISDIVIDGLIDTWLLNGTFVDINDPLILSVPANRRYKDNYSFLDLKLNSYADNRSVRLEINLADIANLGDALSNIPLLGPLVGGILNAVGRSVNITITTIQLPVIGGSNLVLTGSWDAPVAY